MRVLLVIDSLGPGGAERSLVEMLAPLTLAGIQPVVVCLKGCANRTQSELVDQGFDVRSLRATRALTRIAELRRLIGSLRPDLVHTALVEADLAGRLAAMGSGVPVLTSLVNTTYDPVRLGDPNVNGAKLRLWRLVDGWTARHLTAHLHAITRAVKDAAVDTLGVVPERVTVVERGRDPERLGRPSARRRAQARRQLGLADDDEVVVNVGRQEYQKGQRTLLEAVEMLVGERSRLTVVSAGRSGHASADLHEQVRRRRLEGRVRFPGHRDDVPELLAAGDLFVFPSLYEGLGGSVIEAMALGLAVVASDIPALREVVEPDRNALLVPAGDPVALAGAMARLLDDDELRRSFGQRSRQIFEERFTLQPSIDRMVELYRRVAAAPRRSRTGRRRQ